MAPEGSARWSCDREALWNYVERIEVRKDAQLAREINLALILLYTRKAEFDGLRRVKIRAWNSEEMLMHWRSA